MGSDVKMDFKKLVFVFLLVGMLSLQPIFAAQSEIKVYGHFPTEINTLNAGDKADIDANLYVDNEREGGIILGCYITDPNGDMIFKDWDTTESARQIGNEVYYGGPATFHVDTTGWTPGSYNLKIRYEGSIYGKCPEAEVNIPIYIKKRTAPHTSQIIANITKIGKNKLTVQGLLYVDNEIIGWRTRGFYVIDSKGDLIAEDYAVRSSGVTFDTTGWAPGDYDIKIRYEGSPDGEWPEAETHLKVHIH